MLADALHYAREQGATHIVDFATLTGAMSVALGDLFAGWFANDDEWAAHIDAASTTSGDLGCRFPLHPRYRRFIDSTFADMKNGSELRNGACVLAAAFLAGVRRRRAVGAHRHGRARVTSRASVPTTHSTRAAPATACG